MTHGQRAYAHDASGLTMEDSLMATYNASTLPKGVASGLADAAKAECPGQPDMSDMNVALSGDIHVTITRGAAHPKRTAPIDWQAVALAAMAKMLPAVRQAILRDALAGVGAGVLTPSEREALAAEAASIVAAMNAAKPPVLQPGQRTVRFGAVEISIASSLPAMRAE
jgi:hypothetical protein